MLYTLVAMCNGISDTNFTSVALYLNSDNCNISVHENEFGLIAKILISIFSSIKISLYFIKITLRAKMDLKELCLVLFCGFRFQDKWFMPFEED